MFPVQAWAASKAKALLERGWWCGGDTDCLPPPPPFRAEWGGCREWRAPFFAGGEGAEPAHLPRREQRAGRAPGGAWAWKRAAPGGGRGRRLGAPGAASSMRQGSACLLRGAPLPQPFCSAAAMLGAVPRARAGSSDWASGRWRRVEGCWGAVVTAAAALMWRGAFCWAFLGLTFRGGDCVLSSIMSRSRSVMKPQNACGFFPRSPSVSIPAISFLLHEQCSEFFSCYCLAS